jgi:NADH-ubiquinone oxidoreductase chain 1
MIFQIQNSILIESLLILFLFLPLLLAVAYLTVFERKALARMQRRVGPETTGPEGVLQAFADALKVSLKEQIIPSHSNKIIFYIAPISTLIFSLLN